MELELFFRLFLNGLVLAAIYILVASGLSLVMGVTKILNFAHTGYYMLGAFVFGTFYGLLHLSWILATVFAVFVGGLMGGITYCLVFKPLRYSRFFIIVSSVSLYRIFVQAIVVAFGEKELIVPPVFRGFVQIGGFSFPVQRLMLILFSLLAMLSVYFLLNTKIGRAMRAVALDEEAAVLQGINCTRIFLIAVVVGCSLSAIAGAVICPIFAAQAHMGSGILILVLLVVKAGGLGSIRGSIVSGFMLGLAESFGYQFIPGGSLLVIFVVIAISIYFRPGGLFGTFREWE